MFKTIRSSRFVSKVDWFVYRVSLIHIWMFFLLIYFSFLFLFADEGKECPSLQYFIDDCNIVNNYADLGADGYKDLFTGACNRHQLCYTCVSCIQTYRIFSKPRLCVRAQTFRRENVAWSQTKSRSPIWPTMGINNGSRVFEKGHNIEWLTWNVTRPKQPFTARPSVGAFD